MMTNHPRLRKEQEEKGRDWVQSRGKNKLKNWVRGCIFLYVINLVVWRFFVNLSMLHVDGSSQCTCMCLFCFLVFSFHVYAACDNYQNNQFVGMVDFSRSRVGNKCVSYGQIADGVSSQSACPARDFQPLPWSSWTYFLSPRPPPLFC